MHVARRGSGLAQGRELGFERGPDDLAVMGGACTAVRFRLARRADDDDADSFGALVRVGMRSSPRCEDGRALERREERLSTRNVSRPCRT